MKTLRLGVSKTYKNLPNFLSVLWNFEIFDDNFRTFYEILKILIGINMRSKVWNRWIYGFMNFHWEDHKSAL